MSASRRPLILCMLGSASIPGFDYSLSAAHGWDLQLSVWVGPPRARLCVCVCLCVFVCFCVCACVFLCVCLGCKCVDKMCYLVCARWACSSIGDGGLLVLSDVLEFVVMVDKAWSQTGSFLEVSSLYYTHEHTLAVCQHVALVCMLTILLAVKRRSSQQIVFSV